MTAPRKPYKLDQLGFVGRGRSRHRPRNDPSLYGGPYPFFQTGDVKAAEMFLHIHSQTYNETGLAQSKLWEPGTLCITIAANIAETAILSIPGCFPDSVVGFIADPKRADTAFIKYYLNTLKLLMQSASRGTTQDNLSLDKLLTFDFLVPEVSEQRHIASVLSAYDDLIENNHRRISILEEMARRLYEEWFVNFQFPGHKPRATTVRSEGQDCPSDWSVSSIRELADIFRGRSYRSVDLVEDGGKPFINLKCIDRDGGFRKDGLKRYAGNYNTNHEVEPGDIVMAVTDMTQERRIVAQAGLVPFLDGETGVISMDLVKITPKTTTEKTYLYAFLRWSMFPNHVKNHATGANVLHLHPDRISEYSEPTPPLQLQRVFSGAVKPMIHLADCLATQTENLLTQRDLLLPKLVSGEIDVSDMPMPGEDSEAA